MLFTTCLKENKSFMRAYRQGRFTADKNCTVYFVANKTPYNRLGITVSKKLGGAVQRNRVKRIIRAAYRLNEDKFPMGYDIVFVGRNNVSDASSKDIEKFINSRVIKEMNKPSKAKQKGNAK